MKFLRFMEDDDESKYTQVNAIRDPLSLLVKAQGTNKVQFTYGITLFLVSPLETKPEPEGYFLAFHEYIDATSKNHMS